MLRIRLLKKCTVQGLKEVYKNVSYLSVPIWILSVTNLKYLGSAAGAHFIFNHFFRYGSRHRSIKPVTRSIPE